MARLASLHPNLNALLDTIAVSEGTSTSPITQDDGYDIIVTGLEGPERFSDYSAHPFAGGRKSKQINRKGLTSNASGRYQFMLRDYAHYRNLLKLKDFGPVAQDEWAIRLILERRAMPYLMAGDFTHTITLINNLWASLPGAGYNQHENPFEDLKEVYIGFGGKFVC